MRNGYFHLLTWHRIPLRVHWSSLILVAYTVGAGMNAFLEGLGLWTLILVHEAGHAALCRLFRLKVLEIRLFPFLGQCIFEDTHNMRQRVIIAWGGVLAQLAVLLGALVACNFTPTSVEPRSYLGALLFLNLVMVIINLIPAHPLDGFTAWKLRYLFGSELEALTLPRSAPRHGRADIERLVDDALREATRPTRPTQGDKRKEGA